jgi:DNA-binding LacI/PurR family transcriptional regulator
VLLSLPSPSGRLSLNWKHFICVTKGVTVRWPPVHRVVSSHYEDMKLAMAQLARRGYRRVGLVLGKALSERVDRAWLAAYLLHNNEQPAAHRIPALITRTGTAENDFMQWRRRHRPEVILFSEQPIPQWVRGLGLRVPRDIGLVCLDWSSDLVPLAGIDSMSELQGEAAIDLLVGQLQSNEYGIPNHEKIISIRGRWIPGTTIRGARRV